MTLRTETIKQIECDICHAKDIRQRRHGVIFQRNNIESVVIIWDICFNCFDKFSNIITFLTITVGLDIKYSVVDDVKGE